MGKVKRYAPEVRERAVRMVMNNHGEFQSQWAAIQSVSQKTSHVPNLSSRRWTFFSTAPCKSLVIESLGSQTPMKYSNKLVGDSS